SKCPPDNRLAATPYCRVVSSATRRFGGASRYPSIRPGIVLTARGEITIITTTPDDHFVASPHCGMPVSPRGGIASAGIRPTVRDGIIFVFSVKRVSEPIRCTLDDYFTSC